MDPHNSHLSEQGRKNKYAMIEKLERLARQISKEKNYYIDHPPRDVRIALQSINYHTEQITGYADTLNTRVQRFIEQEIEEYHRKVKQSTQIRNQNLQKLDIGLEHKSKALCGYEQEYDALKDKFENIYGRCPVQIVEPENTARTTLPEPIIIDPVAMLKESLDGFFESKGIPLTQAPTLITPPVVSAPVVVEQKPEPEPVKPVEPVKEKPKVEVVVNKTPLALFDQEELELQRLREESRRIEREQREKEQEQKERDLMLFMQRRKAQEDADINRQRQQRSDELTAPPPVKPKKGVVRGSLAQGPSIHLYSLPEES